MTGPFPSAGRADLPALWSDVRWPVLGMLHVPPLPGSPRYQGNRRKILETVLQDAAALQEGGVQGLILENFGDTPFTAGRVPPQTVAAMTMLATEVRRAVALPLGINVLRNDGRSALAIAAETGAEFIRVNILSGARLTDQGVIQGIAHDLLRDRSRYDAGGVRIFADVNVKHSAPLAQISLADEVADLVHRGGADALIVSGRATGQPAEQSELRDIREAAGNVPVFVGSGVTAANIGAMLPDAAGFIVGTGFKRDEEVGAPVDVNRVRRLMQAIDDSAGSAPKSE